MVQSILEKEARTSDRKWKALEFGDKQNLGLNAIPRSIAIKLKEVSKGPSKPIDCLLIQIMEEAAYIRIQLALVPYAVERSGMKS